MPELTELEELRSTIDLIHKSDALAIKMWQKAHPGQENIWPDRAHMIFWLLEQVDQPAYAERLLSRIHETTKPFYEPKKPKADPCPYDKILHAYQKILVSAGMPDVRALSEKRKRAVRKLWQEHLTTIDDWRAYFRDARTKPFLFGRNDRGWKADFDFMVREDSLLKMQEGKYNG